MLRPWTFLLSSVTPLLVWSLMRKDMPSVCAFSAFEMALRLRVSSTNRLPSLLTMSALPVSPTCDSMDQSTAFDMGKTM